MLFSLNRPDCLLLAFGLGQALCQAEFVQDIKPLLERYCFKCHGNKRAKAEVNLEALGTRPDFSRDGRMWEKVHHMLNQREMPPEQKPQPTEDERSLLTEFIDAQLA